VVIDLKVALYQTLSTSPHRLGLHFSLDEKQPVPQSRGTKPACRQAGNKAKLKAMHFAAPAAHSNLAVLCFLLYSNKKIRVQYN